MPLYANAYLQPLNDFYFPSHKTIYDLNKSRYGVCQWDTYNGTTEDFDANEEITVSVNLQKIIGERNNVNDYHFNVINGSKIQTVTLNPDGTTTTEKK